jgi:hypothetical protein
VNEDKVYLKNILKSKYFKINPLGVLRMGRFKDIPYNIADCSPPPMNYIVHG